MDKAKLEDSLKAALVELQEYLNLQVKYNKLLLAKKMGEIFAQLALFLLVIGISGFLLIFLSFAFVSWYDLTTGTAHGGHLIVSGFYLLLILIILIFRKGLIFTPVRKLFGNVMFGDDEDHVSFEEAFKSTESLNLRIRKYKKALKRKEEKLGKKYETLSTQFTFTNIVQSIVKNAYASFVTTSNIAKTAFNLAKRFTRKKRKKQKYRKGYIPEDLEKRPD